MDNMYRETGKWHDVEILHKGKWISLRDLYAPPKRNKFDALYWATLAAAVVCGLIGLYYTINP